MWQPAVVEPSLVDGEVLDASTLGATRGDVRGAGGARLVTARPVMRFGVDRGQVSKKQALRAAGRLAALAGLDAAAYRDRVAAAGDEAFVEAIVYRRDDVPSALAQGYPDVAGIVAIAGEQPLAPTRDFAAALLGNVGEVTAEMIEAAPETYRIGDQAGLSGLQARYDEELQGTPGILVRAVEDGAGTGGERELLGARGGAGRGPAADPRRRPPTRGRAPAVRCRARQRAGRTAAQHRRGAGRGQRPGQRDHQRGHLRAGRPRQHLQDRHQPGAAARRPDPGLDRALHAPGGRRRQVVQELLRLPGGRPRRHHAAPGDRELVQHRADRARRQASTAPTSTTPPPRWAWGSTTTWASRRTSAASRSPGATPRPPPR